jgi:lipopolysaccharide export LptBFGC system permease protein LptF
MILQRYILRELAGSFAFAFCTVLSVCLVGTMFQVFRTFPGVGYEILAKAMPLAMGAIASWVMLVASCTSSTLVYARLSAENEITAMRACGIHLWSMATPAVLLGLLLVLAAYPLNEIIVPTTRHNRRLAFRDSIVFALREPPAGQQDFRIGSTRIIYTDYVDNRMVRPTVSEFKKGTLVRQCFAPAGQIVVNDGPTVTIKVILTKPRVWQIGKYETLFLRDGRKIEAKRDEKEQEIEVETRSGKKFTVKKSEIEQPAPPFAAGTFQRVHLLDGRKLDAQLREREIEVEIEPKTGKKEIIKKSDIERIQPPSEDAFSAENDLTIEIPTDDLDNLKRQAVDMPQDELWWRIHGSKDPRVRNPMILFVHTRFASSLAPMLLVLIGMPIGIMVSRGSRLAGLGAALPPLLIYFISFFIFQGLGVRNKISPLLAAYLPDLFLAVIAGVLLLFSVRR